MRPTLRLATPADGAALAQIYAPVVRDTDLSFETTAPDAAEMARRVREGLGHAPWLVAEQDGEVLGYAYAARFRARPAYDWTCEVSVYVDAPARRRGVGRALYLELFELVRAQGFRTALAVIALPNPESALLHARLGFEEVGVIRDAGFKHGTWRDTQWWRLGLGPGRAPEPTLSVAEAWRLRSAR